MPEQNHFFSIMNVLNFGFCSLSILNDADYSKVQYILIWDRPFKTERCVKEIFDLLSRRGDIETIFDSFCETSIKGSNSRLWA
jgi:hypothetical protein